MAGVDLSAQFEQIPERAKVASDQVTAVRQRSQDQLRTAAGSARKRATAAADKLQDKPDEPTGTVSPHWQDIRAKWRAHVAAVQSEFDQAGDDIEGSYAIADADLAESYAIDAINFAAAAIDEAESATLNAMYCRTRATALNP